MSNSLDRKYIEIKGEVYIVSPYHPDMELIEGFAYVIGANALPFRGQLKKFKDKKKKPGIYVNKHGEHVIYEPFGGKKYRLKNVYDINLDFINKSVANGDIRTMDDAMILAETNDVFEPPIADNDNTLQKLVKKILKGKQIDLKNYSHRFKSNNDINNWSRAVIFQNTMSFDRFDSWSDILDVEYQILVRDKKGAANPFNKIISISNNDDLNYEEEFGEDD